MSKSMWLTCTPVSFNGDASFFARDSGLLCKGFQEIGVPCKAILPMPEKEGDQTDDLIRTEYNNLQDPAWWRSLDGTGVVFYGWGDGRYLPIVQAMKQAGLFVVTNMDTHGLFSMAGGIRTYTASLWRESIGRRGCSPFGISYFVWRTLYSLTLRRLRVDRPRALHFSSVDVIGCISPLAAERIKHICWTYGGDAMAAKIRLIPHPNPTYMIFDESVAKERLVVAVGRWDDEKIKGTDLLLSTIDLLLRADQHVAVEVYGTLTSKMHSFRSALPAAIADRFHLFGNMPNTQLRLALQRARVSLCTSLAESYHNVSAEALCSGCSIVGPNVPEIPSMQWFTNGPFGCTAKRTAPALAAATIAEMAAWDRGARDPSLISTHWSGLLHAPRVAELVINTRTEILAATSSASHFCATGT